MGRICVFVPLIVIYLALGTAGLCSAENYYVDASSGDDGNDGGEEHPWPTITHALDWIGSENTGNEGNAHTIYMADGTYSAFTACLPAAPPFDAPGEFTLFATLVEPGTLSPHSDVGLASFSLE